MRSRQEAANILGDVMKLLAQGCHVKVGAFVFKLSELGREGYIHWQWFSEYPNQAWGDSKRNVELWIEELLNNDFEVLYVPPIPKKPTKRQVRSIEL